jgi:hypothetical protein
MSSKVKRPVIVLTQWLAASTIRTIARWLFMLWVLLRTLIFAAFWIGLVFGVIVLGNVVLHHLGH